MGLIFWLKWAIFLELLVPLEVKVASSTREILLHRITLIHLVKSQMDF